MTTPDLTRKLTPVERLDIGAFLAATIGHLVSLLAIVVLGTLTLLGLFANVGLIFALAAGAALTKIYLVGAQWMSHRRWYKLPGADL